MESIHTIGIALDPSAAKSGGAEAAAAFAQVGQAAQSMGSTVRVAAAALGPVATALGSVATALAAIDFNELVSDLKETTTPLEMVRRQLVSVSDEAGRLRGSLNAAGGSAFQGQIAGKLLAPAKPTDRVQPSVMTDAFVGVRNATQEDGDAAAKYTSAAFAPFPTANTPPFSIPVPAKKVEDLSFPSASSMAPAQLTALPGLNFAALPQDIAATSGPFDTLKRKVDSTSDAQKRGHVLTLDTEAKTSAVE